MRGNGSESPIIHYVWRFLLRDIFSHLMGENCCQFPPNHRLLSGGDVPPHLYFLYKPSSYSPSYSEFSGCSTTTSSSMSPRSDISRLLYDKSRDVHARRVAVKNHGTGLGSTVFRVFIRYAAMRFFPHGSWLTRLWLRVATTGDDG
jgi:hypothetical protein